MRGYIYLTISIAGEIFATTMLKLSDGFTVLLPSAGVMFGYALSFYCLSLCLNTVPLSLAYAIWSGAGTALTALIGAILWGEAFSSLKILGIILIIGGIIALNSSSNAETAKEPSR
ncbi:multidrug resistance protein EbrB [Cytobacillus firmus]|uniref:Multidrug resistance protein EbrB n=2 Tax=Cytobacillus TaxID=2675230 RepID=A0A366JPM6_CYTFI|nr:MULTISPECIES: multidrug efflux SMR transporter [Cytobacillus]RBP90039.1 multidrug resistance protein EbrB [Cytobacillus firmus]TDX40487.1 multidrug resistance protein EbrB [Cytobacillus oceanisediminis]